MMHDDKLLLLDVGGTFIKCSHGREVPVNSNGSREEIIAAFRSCYASDAALNADGAAWEGVAVAVPGPFDYKNGIFRMTHKYAAVNGENFRDLAGIPDSVPIRYTHDVNCMLSGEMAYGNGRAWSRVALVTLGTGLGFSMCLDGQILTNELGSPLISICRHPYADGILEDAVSKRGFMSAYEAAYAAACGAYAAACGSGCGQAAFPSSVKDIADLAARGDKVALSVFGSVTRILSREIAPILKEKGIECLLFGGQISRSFRFMKDVLIEELSDVPSLKQISEISDFDNATFNGLRSLFEK